MNVSRSFPLLLLWSFTRLYSSSRFFIFALHWDAVRMDVSPCSFNSLFSCLAMDSQTAELCLLLMGWWSFHIAMRNRISASDQLGERPLVPALFSLLEFWSSPTTALVLWYGLMVVIVCDSAGESGRANRCCGSHSWLCHAGKMYGPRAGSGKWSLTWGITKGDLKQISCYVREMLCILTV